MTLGCTWEYLITKQVTMPPVQPERHFLSFESVKNYGLNNGNATASSYQFSIRLGTLAGVTPWHRRRPCVWCKAAGLPGPARESQPRRGKEGGLVSVKMPTKRSVINLLSICDHEKSYLQRCEVGPPHPVPAWRASHIG